MTGGGVNVALTRLGEVLRWPEPIELLLVGGAAGLMTGLLPAERTTADCDVMRYLPQDAVAALELASRTVAEELGLNPRWLNADVEHVGVLPDGWAGRRQRVGQFGELYVYAVGREDLIAMKFYAGRDQDLDDLDALVVTERDATFVRCYLVDRPRLSPRPIALEKIAAALELLDGWEPLP